MRKIRAACVVVFRHYGEADAAMLMVEQKAKAVQLRHNPHAATFWSLPGGKLEEGENFVAAAVRECLEETGALLLRPEFLFQADNILVEDNIHVTLGFVRGETDAAAVPGGSDDPDQQILQACWMPVAKAAPYVWDLLSQYLGHKASTAMFETLMHGAANLSISA